MKSGIAAKIAKPFINSKLTLLLMIAFLSVGIYSSFLIPREEEPQIEVPIADIFLQYPGASPKQVETKVVKPLEKIISNIKGVEYVYSTSLSEQAMLVVQFYVGEDIERSIVKLYNEVYKNLDQMPTGVSNPLIKTRSIDDVPILGLTLWSESYDDFQLKQIAQELSNEIEQINDISTTKVIGGRSREIKIEIDPGKLEKSGIDILEIQQLLQAANASNSSGKSLQNDKEILIHAGSFLKGKEDISNLIIGFKNRKPIYLHEVAKVIDGPESAKNYVSFAYGGASQKDIAGEFPAVTISVSKKKGADAMFLADFAQSKIEKIAPTLLPKEVHLEITRNYGETASKKVSELLMHLIGAIVAVTIIVMFAMGWRGGLVVFLSVPITFALTLFSYYFLDYTLNRITLFALVFVTGIVVDDSIIIAENMHRHFKMKKMNLFDAALYSINEVGNPTILATFTVIASVLPMAFVSGLMGPYMSPMPIGASIAMILSLFVAITITPYLAYHILPEKDEKDAHKEDTFQLENTGLYKLYFKFVNPLLESSSKRWMTLGITSLILFASLSMFYFKSVAVKMLPFDNKNEFQVVIDMPEGSTLERTSLVAKEIGSYIATQPMVLNYQSYIGTASPINFNGLVRHYDMRRNSYEADIQVNLIDKGERKAQSHDIAKGMRKSIQDIANRYGANVKIVEIPPGPPVLSTIVAEIYGPEYDSQIDLANQVKDLLHQQENVVDIDWYVNHPQEKVILEVDKEKAMLSGVTQHQIAQAINVAMTPRTNVFLVDDHSFENVPINLSFEEKDKHYLQKIQQLHVKSQNGNMVSLADVTRIRKATEEPYIYRKNQRPVVYVTADMAGDLESPAYAILGISDAIQDLKIPHGFSIDELYIKQPDVLEDYTVKWDGEWQITLEVFRDLGTAFLVVIIVIYVLIVGWFQKFRSPLVMMVAIPLSMIGIVLGHWVFDAYFTATSMIGMIALAGIMVRNSVLLIDFINLRLNEGANLKQAVIEAGAVRTTPILLTAGTVVIGAFVILFDPIFQGLAISLMAGTIASTFLTLLIVPMVYYMMEKSKHKVS
ncbi:efflux RND transporter permease subunit [Aureivirga sp. CE67]|uniref:efflux RND transporter permease subunit n=1 Tax=Aureivirga sp. CE67 TaxID=1788983 RepID=UPI0018C93C87|nr:efflux RND transporter permease subunit [Aureivirga sp. CE67]